MPPETPEPMVQDFVTKAEHDLLAATILAREPRLADAVCFHRQQAVEKMLKAALRVGENVNRREFVAREASREGTLPRLPQDEREARRQETLATMEALARGREAVVLLPASSERVREICLPTLFSDA